MDLKWEECILLKGNREIADYFSKKSDRLFIVAQGFDPRTCCGLECFLQVDPDIHVILVNYSETPKSTSYDYNSDSRQNREKIQKVCKPNQLREVAFDMWKEEEGRKTSLVRKYIELNFKKDMLLPYQDIIVDISAMPRSVYANLLKVLLKNKEPEQHLFVVVCENSAFDDTIITTNAFETAEYLNGVGAYSIGQEADNNKTTVWMPMLGGEKGDTLNKLYNFIKPDEICPILPFPSENIRRSERILRNNELILFQTMRIEKNNILYVSENSPIQAYKKLCKTVEYYAEAFSILSPKNQMKDTKFIFSMQSSKLMELGMLMAVFDLASNRYKVGIATVENEGYYMEKEKCDINQSQLYCVGLDISIYD